MEKHLQNISDTELVLKAKERCLAAFETLYDRHSTGVGKTLASFAGWDQDVIDDLTQDVFFRVIDNLESYIPTHSFTKWLYTIALNVGRNYLRSRSKLTLVDQDEFENLPNERNRVREFTEEIIANRALKLVTELPGHLREVVALRIGSGMRFEEIGVMLEIPSSTARSRMQNALGILRKKLGIITVKKEPGYG